MISNNQVNNQTNICSFDSVLNFVNSKIYCKTHINQQAKSICMDCKTFCCMVENCGQPHIYHSIENLEYLVNTQVFPILSQLRDINKNYSQNKSELLTNVHNLKNNLRNFAVNEKKLIDEDYRMIIQSIQKIYNSHMDDINEFIENLNSKFESLHEKINTVYFNDEGVKSMNDYLGNLLRSCNSNEHFLTAISPQAKIMNNKLKSISNQLSKFDFVREINEIKVQAEKDYPKTSSNEYFKTLRVKLEQETNTFILSKKKKDDRKSLSKIKKMISIRQTISSSPNTDIDLDLFVRVLNDEINKIRKNPSEVLHMLDEYVDILNSPNDDSINLNESSVNNSNINSKITYIYEYINSLIRDRVSLSPLEWDNDLSNSAEDYLTQGQGKIDKDRNVYLAKMKEFVTSYYNNYQNMNSVSYVGMPQFHKIILFTLLNENLWDMNTKQNLIFSQIFNVVGIFAISAGGYNRINLIINMSSFNK